MCEPYADLAAASGLGLALLARHGLDRIVPRLALLDAGGIEENV